MKKFEMAQIQVDKFEVADVITTSEIEVTVPNQTGKG